MSLSWSRDFVTRSSLNLGRVVALTLAGSVSVLAQCQPEWLPGEGPAYAGDIRAILETANGDLYVGTNQGQVFGLQGANYIARRTGGQWIGVGTEPNGHVLALAELQNGDVIAGGQFVAAGAVTLNGIGRWDGASWSPLASGVTGSVYALHVQSNGTLVVGGDFTVSSFPPVTNIGIWNGSYWGPIAFFGGPNGPVHAITSLANGNLVIGGQFSSTGFTSPNNIAVYDGSAWSVLGSGTNGTNGTVRALQVLANGDLIAAGDFTTAGGVAANHVARWDGSSWSALGTGHAATVQSLARLPGGDLVAGLGAPGEVSRWNGSSWSSVGTTAGGSPVRALRTLSGGHVLAGGFFANMNGVPGTQGLARFDGTTWSRMGGGFDIPPFTVARRANGDLLLGGEFGTAPGLLTPVAPLVQRSGSVWSEVTAPPGTTSIRSLLGLADGRVAATMTNLVAPVWRFMLWDGTTWTDHSDSVGTYAEHALVELSGGRIATITLPSFGHNSVRLWDGSTWQAIDPNATCVVTAIAADANGDLIACGSGVRSPLDDGVVRWDGAAWSDVGPVFSGGAPSSLTTMPNGDLVTGGAFTTIGAVSANRLARWNGTAWSEIPGVQTAGRLAAMSGGDLAMHGLFSSQPSTNRVMRWDGSSWSAFGSGTESAFPEVVLLALPGDGLAVTRFIRRAGGLPSHGFALWACPPIMPGYAVFGAGCPGALGIPGNTATAPPRLGNTLSVDFTDLPEDLGVLVFGWNNVNSTLGPLPYSLASYGAPGCFARVSNHAARLLMGTNGTATYNLPIPNAPFFLDAHFYTQALVLDAGANGLGAVMSDAADARIGN